MKRIGLIIPSSNRMVEQEMVRVLPPEVCAHVARLRMTGAHERPLERLLPDVRDAAATLDDARCEAIAFHCTANSTSEGTAGEDSLLDALRAGSTAAVTTTATAIREALTAVRARRIVLVTPYTAAVTEHEAEFFTAAGFLRWLRRLRPTAAAATRIVLKATWPASGRPPSARSAP